MCDFESLNVKDIRMCLSGLNFAPRPCRNLKAFQYINVLSNLRWCIFSSLSNAWLNFKLSSSVFRKQQKLAVLGKQLKTCNGDEEKCLSLHVVSPSSFLYCAAPIKLWQVKNFLTRFKFKLNFKFGYAFFTYHLYFIRRNFGTLDSFCSKFKN